MDANIEAEHQPELMDENLHHDIDSIACSSEWGTHESAHESGCSCSQLETDVANLSIASVTEGNGSQYEQELEGCENADVCPRASNFLVDDEDVKVGQGQDQELSAPDFTCSKMNGRNLHDVVLSAAGLQDEELSQNDASADNEVIDQGESALDAGCKIRTQQEISRSPAEGTGPKEPGDQEAANRYEAPKTWKDVVVLSCPSTSPGEQCTIYMVGTAHVSMKFSEKEKMLSQESCEEVASVIQSVRPEVVFLELCSSRVGLLKPQMLQVPTISEMLNSWRSKRSNVLGIIYGWFLCKVSAKLDVFPGSEFRVAYEGAMACGAKVTLGDRPVQITLRRTWAKMSFWEKSTLIYCMIFRSLFLPNADELSEMVEGMKDNDMVTRLIQEMGKRLPTVMETLIFERDLYMTAMLRLVAKDYSSIVAVVGKGHVPGITENWDKSISVESLMFIPTKKNPSKLWGVIAVSVGGLAIASAVYYARRR